MKLTFRKKGIDPAIKKRILHLIIIFVVCTCIFETVLNLRTKESESVLRTSTLPLVTTESYGEELNLLRGYTSEMNGMFMRDAVVPLPGDLNLPVNIYTYGAKLSDFSYEIRSTDAKRKIADTDVTPVSTSADKISLSLPIENLVNEGEEYLLLIKMKMKKNELTYYTRIMLPAEDNDIEKSIDFVKEFHDMTFSKDIFSAATYVETDPYTNHETLHDVNIKSTVNQICWGNFDCEIIGDPVLSITDLSSNYNALEMNYRVVHEGENGKEYFDVREYFKVRQGIERMYLLDYRRKMDQTLDPSSVKVSGNSITVGVTDPDVNYLSNETGTIAAFSQNGELFLYDINNGNIMRIFSFANGDNEAVRENYNAHDMRLLSIDETGSVDFVVYGYQNAGAHEGKCGTVLFHYDSNEKQVKEQIFVETSMSYPVLRLDYNDLIYKSTNDMFYFMSEGTLTSVNLKNMKQTEMFSELPVSNYSSSRSGRFLAWTDEPELSKELHVMDLEDESEFTIKPDNSGDYIRVLSFMEEDLVYGIVHEEDGGEMDYGAAIYPVSEVRIEDIARGTYEILKSYTPPEGTKVSEVTRNTDSLIISLVKKDLSGHYVYDSEDTIRNTSGVLNRSVVIKEEPDEVYGSVVNLIMAQQSGTVAQSVVREQEVGLVLPSYDDSVKIKENTNSKDDMYFVYVGAEALYMDRDPARAITNADTNLGVVINSRQKYIWKRGAASYVNPIKDPEEKIQGDDKQELFLKGCTVSQMFYYISIGTPVKAKYRNGSDCLITGYDNAAVIIYNTETGKNTRMPLEDAENEFVSFTVYI